MKRAHEEGLRPVDVVLTSAQNKHAIKEVIDKIEHYRKIAMSMWSVWPTLENQL